jgi:type VI protein secretion system component Hcp
MRKSIVLTTAAVFVVAAAACPSPAAAKSKNKPKVSEISVTKTTDKASPSLMRSTTAPRDAATGQASGKRMHGR